MEITSLKIHPSSEGCIAKVEIEVDDSVFIKYIRIVSGKSGIYVQWPKAIAFKDESIKRELSNRILATYVIDHCIDSHNVE